VVWPPKTNTTEEKNMELHDDGNKAIGAADVIDFLDFNLIFLK
jgi:hypothetical protein